MNEDPASERKRRDDRATSGQLDTKKIMASQSAIFLLYVPL
jgi:hypothetical protein